jgi:hypothetical protein
MGWPADHLSPDTAEERQAGWQRIRDDLSVRSSHTAGSLGRPRQNAHGRAAGDAAADTLGRAGQTHGKYSGGCCWGQRRVVSYPSPTVLELSLSSPTPAPQLHSRTSPVGCLVLDVVLHPVLGCAVALFRSCPLHQQARVVGKG